MIHETDQTAQMTWRALLKGVRAVNLYSTEHSQVQRHAESLLARAREALGAQDAVLFELTHDGVRCNGLQVYDSADERETLIERLHADGVKQFHLHGVPDLESALRLFAILAPYCHADRAPLRSSAEVLRWEPLQGLSILTQGVDVGPGGLEDDLGARERQWHNQLLAPAPGLAAPVEVEALRAVWDGTGGVIPWPPPLPESATRKLVDEVEAANAAGAPLSRVGQLLVRAVGLWADDPRAAELLAPLPFRVEERLDRRRPGDVARLVQPLLLWATEPGGDPSTHAVRERVAELVHVLLSDRNLARLLQGGRDGSIEPVELAAYFGALPPDTVCEVVEFAAALPEGPWREALLAVTTRMAREEGGLLHTTVAAGPLGPALVALDSLDVQPASRTGVQLAMEALNRPEAVLRLRGLRMLLPHPSRTVADAVLRLLSDSNREVRSLALTWVARYEHRPAFEVLLDLTRSARFTQMPLAERLELGRTLGTVGGRDALELVRTNLGERWHRADPQRSAPWLVCLAATGLEEAGTYLQGLVDSAPPHLQHIAHDALNLWRRRQADLADGPAPPVQTAPGAPIPTAHSRPGQPSTGPKRVLSRPAWRGPSSTSPPPARPTAPRSTPGAPPPWQDDDA